jgi:hypothetical protein
MSKVAEPIVDRVICPQCGRPAPPPIESERRHCSCGWSEQAERIDAVFDENLDWSNVT